MNLLKKLRKVAIKNTNLEDLWQLFQELNITIG